MNHSIGIILSEKFMRTKILLFIFSLLNIFTFLSYANDLDLGIYELNRGKFHTAIEQFTPLVAEGYAPAQYQMGIIYKNGYGVIKNELKALELFELAAKQHYSDAQFELALIYTQGDIVKQDLKKAFNLTKAAAIKGLVSAQFNLAIMHFNGAGTHSNYKEASRWYKKAANQNYILAQYNLALLYSEGKGVDKDIEMSFVWNTIASWNGYENAKISLIIDKREMPTAMIKRALAKAENLYRRIIQQEESKAKLTNKKSLY